MLKKFESCPRRFLFAVLGYPEWSVLVGEVLWEVSVNFWWCGGTVTS